MDTKIGLACSMLYYIYLCKHVLIFISDNGIKGGLSTHRTGLSLQLLNVPVLSEEPYARVFVCLFLTFGFFFVRMKSSLEYFLVVFVYSHSFIFALSRGTCRLLCSMGISPSFVITIVWTNLQAYLKWGRPFRNKKDHSFTWKSNPTPIKWDHSHTFLSWFCRDRSVT